MPPSCTSVVAAGPLLEAVMSADPNRRARQSSGSDDPPRVPSWFIKPEARLGLPVALDRKMPYRIARQFKPRFALRSCPVHATAQINLYWPARLNNSPLHIWLRDKIFRLALEASLPMDLPAI